MKITNLSKKVQIIAEVGSVHDGSFGNAQKLVEVAAQCGVDAVKFQTHIPSAETLPDAPTPDYFKGEPRYEYFERTGFTSGQWQELKLHCDRVQVEFLSSPFSVEAVELLETVGITRYKIPSGEVTNIPMLEVIAHTGKPVLLSSGMSTWAELDDAVDTILRYHDRLTVLQCTSQYPCPYEEVGLNVMLEMKDRYQIPVGFSDHTLTPYASLAAATLGASVIEKHLTFSRLMYGSDAQHSLEPVEFKELVQGIRAIEKIISSPVDKDAKTVELQGMKDIFEKSVVSLVDIPKGTIISEAMIGVKKPGTGIPTRQLGNVIGRRAKQHIPKNTFISKEALGNVKGDVDGG